MRPKGKEYVMWAPVPIIGRQGVPYEKPIRLEPEHYFSALKAGAVMGKLTIILFFIITGLIIMNLANLFVYILIVPFIVTTRFLYLFSQPPGHVPHTITLAIGYYKNHFHHS
ncbi:MAG: hypothetical protein KBC17_01110 [Candidatus Pacebacteria bacterium]|nr:hypothetical protein [Candidatus Paceibacterota bacterium]